VTLTRTQKEGNDKAKKTGKAAAAGGKANKPVIEKVTMGVLTFTVAQQLVCPPVNESRWRNCSCLRVALS
jgi:hypothetical protein